MEIIVDDSVVRLLTIIIIAIVGSVPTIYLYKYYVQTKIKDYFLMGTAFLITLFQAITIVLLESYPQTLFLFQINDFMYSTFILMFLIHGMRLKWDKPPRSIKIIATLLYLAITIPVLFYEMVELPNQGQVGFLYLRNISTLDRAQMFVISDLYIIGRGFEFYAHAFRLFSIIIILYAYLDSKEIAVAMNVITSRRIFLISIGSAAIYPLVSMGEMLEFWTIFRLIEWHIFDLITYLGVAYICIKFPETLLISSTQIVRVLEIQKSYQEGEHVLDDRLTEQNYNMSPQILEYLDLIKKRFPELFKFRR